MRAWTSLGSPSMHLSQSPTVFKEHCLSSVASRMNTPTESCSPPAEMPAPERAYLLSKATMFWEGGRSTHPLIWPVLLRWPWLGLGSLLCPALWLQGSLVRSWTPPHWLARSPHSAPSALPSHQSVGHTHAPRKHFLCKLLINSLNPPDGIT